MRNKGLRCIKINQEDPVASYISSALNGERAPLAGKTKE
jgi:hypothetical protein